MEWQARGLRDTYKVSAAYASMAAIFYTQKRAGKQVVPREVAYKAVSLATDGFAVLARFQKEWAAARVLELSQLVQSLPAAS